MSSIKKLTDVDFHSVTKGQDTFLVKFGATWCGPCKALAPIIESVSKEIEIPVYEVDIDDAPDITIQFGIRGVPTIALFKDDKIEKRVTGLVSKDTILKLINE